MGGIAVGLPFLRKLASPREAKAGGDAGLPRRVIMCAYSMGTIRALFTPNAQGSSFDFGTVSQAMEPFKDRSMVVTNLSNAILELTAGTSGHPGKHESVFTGTLMTGAFGGTGESHIDNVLTSYSPGNQERAPNGPSIETVIGAGLSHPGHVRSAVNLGVITSRTPRERDLTIDSNFFYEGAENPVTMQFHPGHAFDMLFSDVSKSGEEPDPALLALRQRRKSVLDGVRDSFADLRQGLDAKDRAVLDEHADKIRQVELDLPELQACTIPDAPPGGELFEAYEGYSMGDYAALQRRVMAHAMTCEIAPVGRFEFGRQQNPFFGIPLVDAAIDSAGWHSPIVHKALGWESQDPVRVAGFSFFVEQFAALLQELDSIVEDEDGRTALDNSLVVLGSDLGDGDGHRARDLSFLVAGGSSRGRWQYHLDGEGFNTNNLWVTLMHLADHRDKTGEVPSEFGLQGFTSGAIDPLLS